MTQPPNTPDPAAPAPQPDDAATGLPLLKSWPAVYIFVLSVFALLVILLTWFTGAFS